jgi:hypothetical protein
VTKIKQWLRKLKPSRRTSIILGVIFGVFVLLNLVILALYHNKTLPHTTINGTAFNNVSLASLPTKVADAKLLPAKLSFSYKNTSVTYTTKELGVVINEQQVSQAVKDYRSWLPVANLFKKQTISAPLAIHNQAQFKKTFVAMQKTFQQTPANAQIVQDKGNFVLKSEANGYKLEQPAVERAIASASYQTKSKIVLPVTTTKPTTTKKQLQTAYATLQKQRETPITLQYQGQTKKLTPQEVGGMYGSVDTSLAPVDALISNAVTAVGTGFGTRVGNTAAAVTAIKAALESSKPLTFTLEPAATAKKTITYCVQLKGVDESNRDAFQNKLSAVYADSRGWSLGGDVAFQRVDGGCSMIVWLAAADQVPTFGAICDNIWSCTVHTNVIINYDRWKGASDAWNGGGGSLDDYRSMVINHETGHWFGFNHRFCSGAGQLAPVMQQQSIDLQGCKANSWPLPFELAAYRSSLGL